MAILERAQRLFPLTSKRIVPDSTLELGPTVGLPSGYHPTNPALVRYEDGYFVCVRGVNYVYESPRSLVPTFTAGRGYHSLNRFILLDKDFKVRRQITELDGYLDNVEDIRLFEHAGRVHGIGTKPLDSDGSASRMCLIAFDQGLSDATLTSIESPFGFRREKNWCPFSNGSEIGFLYSCSPAVLVRLPPGQQKPSPANPLKSLPDTTQLRFLDCGSTPAQRTEHGFLFVTHRRSVQLPSFRRVYSSRLCLVSEDLQQVRQSAYFSIGEPTIQFISGLALTDSEVLLSYGVMDNRAFLSRFDRKKFFAALPCDERG
jgi:hypothetical protein